MNPDDPQLEAQNNLDKLNQENMNHDFLEVFSPFRGKWSFIHYSFT